MLIFNKRFKAARHEKGCYEQNISIYFFFCKGLSNDDIAVARGTVFQEIWPAAGSKTGHFVIEKLGGLPYNDSAICYDDSSHVKKATRGATLLTGELYTMVASIRAYLLYVYCCPTMSILGKKASRRNSRLTIENFCCRGSVSVIR